MEETVKEKQVKDYLHLYLGCEVARKINEFVAMERATLVGVTLSEVEEGKTICIVNWPVKDCETNMSDVWHEWYAEEAIPILRKLSDITEEEEKAVYEWFGGSRPYLNTHTLFPSEAVIYLLSKGFDLFNLIPDKLAIDKATLPPIKQ